MWKRVGSLTQEIYGYRSVGRAVSSATSAMSAKAELPRLPVPPLRDTLAKYLTSVRPHLTADEFATTAAVVDKFAAHGGVGQKLQRLLEQRAEQHTNWLEEWWLHSAYLDFRWPVVVFSNPGLVFPPRQFRDQEERLRHAARTVLAALDYKLIIDRDGIPVEKMGKSPLDMSQYKRVFGTCRIPGLTRDTLSFNNTKYITVIHNNHLFHVDMWGGDGTMLNEEQTLEQLRAVVAASPARAAAAVGVLTSEHRDVWGKAYHQLTKDATNRASLEDVERSLLVLCLDTAVGLEAAGSAGGRDAQRTLAGAQTIHGGGAASNGANRWFDKTVQFIVGADGVTGLTYEHSPAEGQPIAVLTDFLIDYIEQNKSAGRPAAKSVSAPKRLEFNISSDMAEVIHTAEKNLDKLVDDLELNCFTYTEYGKDFIKSQRLSPDSYLQMAMQFAFYRLHRVPGAHYESAATRMYAGGRTETIRSCSVESVAFARAMLDPAASPQRRLAAMHAAIQAHKDYTVQALQGRGVDRHLLGLKLVAVESGEEVPELYRDVGFVKSGHMRISTSQVACKCDGFMCYGPLVADGYATCYNPRAAGVNFATAAFRAHPDTSAERYRACLEQALADMRQLLLHTANSKL